MNKYKNEKEYMKSKITTIDECELYEIWWGDYEDESVLMLCNASKDNFERELAYFKKFREDNDVEIWGDFESFLVERGYKAERYFIETPTYINYHNCNIN